MTYTRCLYITIIMPYLLIQLRFRPMGNIFLMTRWFEPMTGRDLSHVTTWDFLIFLLKQGYLIDKFMVFFDLRTSRLNITAINQPNRPKRIPGIHLGRGPADVTKVEHYAGRAASFYTDQSKFVRNAQLCLFRSQLNQRTTLWSKGCPKVKTCRFFYLNRNVTKGHLISKTNCKAEDSPKKRTNEFVFTTVRRVFVHFLGESSAWLVCFRN